MESLSDGATMSAAKHKGVKIDTERNIVVSEKYFTWRRYLKFSSQTVREEALIDCKELPMYGRDRDT
jgi:hypothetical protein